ncbi:YjcZ family sporulation protein [Priestia endophytica]|nr:YjcZ family sporulation protein [Priestia endophytica]MED4070413.1 YjcZ family sporulation protein [Priestia endophytica]
MGEKGFNCGSGFALIVVLFILLIIVGATWCC